MRILNIHPSQVMVTKIRCFGKAYSTMKNMMWEGWNNGMSNSPGGELIPQQEISTWMMG